MCEDKEVSSEILSLRIITLMDGWAWRWEYVDTFSLL
jgi:hypothetical protein